MAKAKRISARELETFNSNAKRLSDGERQAFLDRLAHQNAIDARCDKAIARALMKWLGKQVRGQRVSPHKIEADVAVIMLNGIRAKRSVAFKRPAEKWFDLVAAILKRYDAEVVRQADPLGMAMGIRFNGSAYRNGAGNVFFVA